MTIPAGNEAADEIEDFRETGAWLAVRQDWEREQYERMERDDDDA